MFFKMITLENGYKLSDKHLYKYFETPMDYLQKCISKFNFYQSRENKSEVMPFSSIVMDKIFMDAVVVIMNVEIE